MFRRAGLRFFFLLGDLIIISLSLYISTWLRPQLEIGKAISPTNTALGGLIYILALIIWATSFLLLDVYYLQKNLRVIDELQRVIVAHLVATLTFAGALYFSFRNISRLQILIFALISLCFLLIFRLSFRAILYLFGNKRYGSRRILIVGAGSVGHEAAQLIIQHQWTGLHLIGFVDDNARANTLGYPYFGSTEKTYQITQEKAINEIIFALPRQAHIKMANIITSLQDLKVNIRVIPDFFDLVFLRSAVEDFSGMALVTLREPALDPFQRLVKRIFDIIVASLMLVLTLPITIITAIIIKFDSPGPIIFKQNRVGENGRIFKMYKFRTMLHDAESRQDEIMQETADGVMIHKLYDDPRVTKAGKPLRQFSLDELPQLVNIIKGDMSLVGPRPELPQLVDRYEPWQRKRFEVPQGLTGWWQINGRSNKLMHLHTEDDLYYIKNYSLWLDLQILWHTIKAVIERRGAF